MSGNGAGRGTATVMRAVVVLVAVALGTRVAWWIMAPLVPLLVTIVVLMTLYAVVFGQWRR